MPWSYLHDLTTGRLLSESDATVVPKVGQAVHVRTNRAAEAEMWDEATRTFVARPPKVLADRLDDLQTWPEFQRVWAVLNAARRTDLRTALIRLIGRHRFRNQAEPAEIDGGEK